MVTPYAQYGWPSKVDLLIASRKELSCGTVSVGCGSADGPAMKRIVRSAVAVIRSQALLISRRSSDDTVAYPLSKRYGSD